ncbi:MAG: transporter substrate-binding domain-containing protein [Clostridia bacterium]|nr:transporter substrate-binding domain-containing protein [Clostridia bacterium]
MKKFIKILMASILAIATLFCFTACGKSDLEQVKENGKIVVGITVYKPMDYLDENDQWTGFDAELAKEFAGELGVNCQFVIITWSQKAIELKSNQIDLIWNGMTASSDLEADMDFSVSYARNAQVAVVKNTSTIATKDQIKTAKVAVESGSAGNKMATAEAMTNVTPVTAQIDALNEVIAGTSEVALIDLTMAQSVVGTGIYSDLKIVEGVEYGAEIFAVGLRKGSDIKAQLDAFLKKKYSDGSLATLAQKYNVVLNAEALGA